MNPIRWKSMRTWGIIIGIIFMYLIIRIRTYEHKAFVDLETTQASEAWEYVADFSNMKHLNPTVLDFKVIAESGNYDHWKYSVEYVERLSHWPHLEHRAVAHFNVTADQADVYHIRSVHRTCLLAGLFCLDSEGLFEFVQNHHRVASKGCACTEHVHYECPQFLAMFCHREVAYQRAAIMGNLKKHFSNKIY